VRLSASTLEAFYEQKRVASSQPQGERIGSSVLSLNNTARLAAHRPTPLATFAWALAASSTHPLLFKLPTPRWRPIIDHRVRSIFEVAALR
jgi:hypothetical protein